jgi:hypothetical protein
MILREMRNNKFRRMLVGSSHVQPQSYGCSLFRGERQKQLIVASVRNDALTIGRGTFFGATL